MGDDCRVVSQSPRSLCHVSPSAFFSLPLSALFRVHGLRSRAPLDVFRRFFTRTFLRNRAPDCPERRLMRGGVRIMSELVKAYVGHCPAVVWTPPLRLFPPVQGRHQRRRDLRGFPRAVSAATLGFSHFALRVCRQVCERVVSPLFFNVSFVIHRLSLPSHAVLGPFGVFNFFFSLVYPAARSSNPILPSFKESPVKHFLCRRPLFSFLSCLVF